MTKFPVNLYAAYMRVVLCDGGDLTACRWFASANGRRYFLEELADRWEFHARDEAIVLLVDVTCRDAADVAGVINLFGIPQEGTSTVRVSMRVEVLDPSPRHAVAVAHERRSRERGRKSLYQQ